MRHLIFIVLLIWPICSARADDLALAKEHYDRATTLYDLQRFAEAAKEYEASFEAVNNPALLFNIGQAYRLAGDYPKAINSFHAYLRRDAETPNRPFVEARLAEMRKAMDARTAVAAPPRPAASQPAPTRASRSRLVAGISVAVLGVGSLALGAGFAVLYRDAFDQLNAPVPGYVFEDAAEDRYKTYRALEYTFFAVGGAALIAGATLIGVGVRDQRAARVAWAPTQLHVSF